MIKAETMLLKHYTEN